MEYSIDRLARMSGITSRTLRHYEQIGLLHSIRKNSSGYRIYGVKEVDRLQQILFFRTMGIPLKEIKAILDHTEYDEISILHKHLQQLKEEHQRMEQLINTVEKTISYKKEDIKMSDHEKFIGLKQKKITENEQNYGTEIREKYGAETVEKSNQKYMNLTAAEMERMEVLAQEIQTGLETAVLEHIDPKSEAGQRLAQKHKEWLGYTWPTYSYEAHLGLCQMYLDDHRFLAYYDINVSGCAQFLLNAVKNETKV
jgi:DNA-binding transcriptional MerR regulator